VNRANHPAIVRAREDHQLGATGVHLSFPHLPLSGVGGPRPRDVSQHRHANVAALSRHGGCEAHVAGKMTTSVMLLILDSAAFEDRDVLSEERKGRRRVTAHQSSVVTSTTSVTAASAL